MEKKHYYLIAVQFANPTAPSFTEPRVYDVIQRAIDHYNQKSLIVANPKRIIDQKIIDTYTLELKLESSSELALPSKALRVFSKFLVDEGTLTPYIYGKALFKMSAMSVEEINYVAETPSSELSLGQNNIDSGKEKHMKITIADLRQNKIENLFNEKDKIDLILRSFLVEFKKDDQELGLESKLLNEDVYRRLEWDGNEYFDIVNSFYPTFVCALVAYANDIDIKKITQYWDERVEEHRLHNGNKCDYIKMWLKKPFAFGGRFTKDFSKITKDDTELEYCVQEKGANRFYHIGKKAYADKALDPKNIQSDILTDLKSTDNGKLIMEFAELTYCVANFMPCPSSNLNVAKGASIAHDFLPVFVDLIQSCIIEQKELEYTVIKEKNGEKIPEIRKVEVNVLKSWKDWFIANVDEYCLSCYYEVKDGKLKGIPLFKAQSLDHPYPDGVDEVKECLSNMINCIKTRADKLLCCINEQGASK